MIDAHRYRYLIRLLGVVLLGAFLLGTAPCTFTHAGDHEEAESSCVCVCCQEPLAMDKSAVTRVVIHPITSDMVPHGAPTYTPRELLASIFQPPEV